MYILKKIFLYICITIFLITYTYAQKMNMINIDKIIVSTDNWTFCEKSSKKPFVPFGVNYMPGWSGWAPDYFGDMKWDEQKIEKDFITMSQLGVNVSKVVLSYMRILPDPQFPDKIIINQKVLDRFEKMLEIAGRNNIRLIVTLEPSWHGFPKWFKDNGLHYGQYPLDILSGFWKQFAKRYIGDNRIFAYSFCVEIELPGWNEPYVVTEWRKWVKENYKTIDNVNKAWRTEYKSFEEITVAGYNGLNSPDWKKFPEGTDENENKTNDQKLYDFLLFREYIAFRFMYTQTLAIKSVDPEALTSMGFVQWNPILRQLWEPVNEGPFRGPEFNVKEMVKAFDFLGIHFYPVFPNGTDEEQMRYLEIWARYAYSGKPVVLEEFNASPPDKNAWWCRDVIYETRNCVSGWLVWTFQNTEKSDNITEVCGLIDAKGNRTKWGLIFQKLAPRVKTWKLKREPPVNIVNIDKKWIFTSSDYSKILYELVKDENLKPIDFRMESNKSIDNFIMKKELRKE